MLLFNKGILKPRIVVHRSLAEKLYFALAMHFISQPRYNPRTQRDEWYYRIKESFRDLISLVRSRIMLNVGFIEESHRPEDIRDIGKCLT